MKRSVSIGTTVFGISSIGVSVITLLIVMAYGPLPLYHLTSSPLLLSIGLMVLGIIAGSGVVKSKNWGRILMMLLAGFWLLVSIQECGYLIWNSEFEFRDFAVIALAIALIWNGLIIWYFMRPSVKAQFVKTATSDK